MIHLALLVDESGSMGPLRDDVIGGVNDYISKLKEGDGAKDTLVSLYTFDLGDNDEIVRTKVDAQPLKKIGEFADYNPRGSTPLNDAVITTIGRLKQKVSKGDKVLFTIYTDGYENASNASSKEVHEVIAKREKKGWEFIYLGANQDAWAVAQQYGLAKAGQTYSVTHTDKGTRAAFGTAANVGKTFRSEGGTIPQAVASMPKDIGEEELDPEKDSE